MFDVCFLSMFLRWVVILPSGFGIIPWKLVDVNTFGDFACFVFISSWSSFPDRRAGLGVDAVGFESAVVASSTFVARQGVVLVLEYLAGGMRY